MPVHGRPPIGDRDKLIAWLESGRRIRKPALIARAAKLTGLPVEQISGKAPSIKLPAIKTETDEDIIEGVALRFDVMHKLVTGCARGLLRGVIISGLGGVGKSYSAQWVLDEERKNNNVQSETIKGKISAIELFQLLYRNREGRVCLLDDCDPMLAEDDAVTLLKSALDTMKPRTVSWLTNSNLIKDVPNPYHFNGSVVFLTNLNFDQLTGSGQSRNSAHLQSLMTRCAYLDLGLHDPRMLMVWIKHIVTKNHILVGEGLDVQEEADVLAWMAEHRDRLRKLSIRTAIHIAGYVRIEREGWRNMARVMEFRR